MDIYVFSPKLELLGHTDVVTSALWTEKFYNVGTFEFWFPLSDDYTDLFIAENLVWMEEHSTAGIIELVERDMTATSTSLHIGGRFLKAYFDRRAVYPTFNKTGTQTEILQELVKLNCIEPTDSKRKIPNLRLDPEQENLGESTSKQQTGDSLLLVEEELLAAYNLGSTVDFDPITKQLTYKVKKGIIRTIAQELVDPVLISTDMDTILASSYMYMSDTYKNVSYVLGEGEADQRKKKVVGDDSLAGLDRRELYVDARDLQTETYNEETGEQTTVSDSDYQDLLDTRGKEKMQENSCVESFSTTIRTDENAGFLFGQDFFLGDTITVYDSILHVQADVQILEAQYAYSTTGTDITLTLGYPQLTVSEKLRRV